jgi:ribose transport system ATP-binding protein
MPDPTPQTSEAQRPILELRGIRKAFPGVLALDDVDLKVFPGAIHSLVGENGAGKSTLINVMIGLFQPDLGEIRIDGNPVRFTRPADARALGIGLVPQELNLVPHLTVMENILLGTTPLRFGNTAVDWRTMRARAAKVLELIGEEIDLEAEASSLSVAYQQLVQIARALAQDARILILDEPTASLSIPEANRLLALVEQLRDKGGAVIYVSHRLPEVFRLSDQITVMRNGRKVALLDRAEANEAILVRHMIGRDAQQRERKPTTARRTGLPILEVSGLSRVGEFEDISFSMHRGEILGIAGLIGAGRTELARCIFGDTRRSSGHVVLDGQPIEFQHPSEAIKRGVVYVPEERKRLGIFPALDVAENMTLPILSRLSRFFQIRWGRQRSVTDEFVRKFAIKISSQDQLIRNLSGGNQQKVILGRWLATGCRVLLLDEPTRGIDVNAKFEIHRILRELAGAGLAILVISSEFEEVIGLADQIIVMHEGRVKGCVPASEATQEKLLTMSVA